MALINEIKRIASELESQHEPIIGEADTKQFLVMPMIRGLGYDVFNRADIKPEFEADIYGKNGKKVDYAIKKDGKPIIAIECKSLESKLKEHHEQLSNYFYNVDDARLGILTNGKEYRFYSDIDRSNKMDSHPFFIFNLLKFDNNDIAVLQKFTKSEFSLPEILDIAHGLKYADKLKEILKEESKDPSPGTKPIELDGYQAIENIGNPTSRGLEPTYFLHGNEVTYEGSPCWKNLFVSVLNELYKLNEESFVQFANKKRYFSKDESKLNQSRHTLIASGFYVSTQKNSSNIVSNLIELLAACKLEGELLVRLTKK